MLNRHMFQNSKTNKRSLRSVAVLLVIALISTATAISYLSAILNYNVPVGKDEVILTGDLSPSYIKQGIQTNWGNWTFDMDFSRNVDNLVFNILIHWEDYINNLTNYNGRLWVMCDNKTSIISNTINTASGVLLTETISGGPWTITSHIVDFFVGISINTNMPEGTYDFHFWVNGDIV